MALTRSTMKMHLKHQKRHQNSGPMIKEGTMTTGQGGTKVKQTNKHNKDADFYLLEFYFREDSKQFQTLLAMFSMQCMHSHFFH